MVVRLNMSRGDITCIGGGHESDDDARMISCTRHSRDRLSNVAVLRITRVSGLYVCVEPCSLLQVTNYSCSDSSSLG